MYSYDINPQGSPISEPSAATLLPGSTLDGTDYVDYNNVADKAVSLLIQKPSVKFLSPTPQNLLVNLRKFGTWIYRLVLGLAILYLKDTRTVMFQLSGFYF